MLTTNKQMYQFLVSIYLLLNQMYNSKSLYHILLKITFLWSSLYFLTDKLCCESCSSLPPQVRHCFTCAGLYRLRIWGERGMRASEITEIVRLRSRLIKKAWDTKMKNKQRETPSRYNCYGVVYYMRADCSTMPEISETKKMFGLNQISVT